jgi:hypothetical protein
MPDNQATIDSTVPIRLTSSGLVKRLQLIKSGEKSLHTASTNGANLSNLRNIAVVNNILTDSSKPQNFEEINLAVGEIKSSS